MSATPRSSVQTSRRDRPGFLRRLFRGCDDSPEHEAQEPGAETIETSEPEDPGATLLDLLAAVRERIDAPAFERVASAFNLSDFEAKVLLLCAGAELDPRVAAFAAEHGDSRRPYLTFGLALNLLPDPHWSALTPWGPLRRWRLLTLSDSDSPRASALRIDERILHHLAGLNGGGYVDDRLDGLVEILPPPDAPTEPEEALAERIGKLWAQPPEDAPWPVIQLCGPDDVGKPDVAALACARLGWHLLHLRALDIPQGPAERSALARLCERELALTGGALLVTCDGTDLGDAVARTVVPLVQDLSGPLAIATREPLALGRRAGVRIDIEAPSEDERRTLWTQALGDAAGDMENGDLDRLVSQFRLDVRGIRVASALLESDTGTGEAASRALWDACRVQARQRLDNLAQRIEAIATWEDIVLPDPQRQTLEEIAMHVRHTRTVYRTWGFAAKSARGLGISALFTGPSGTGKTMAAEVLANALRLDLYRIDLSQVVSKYIGETEKNLKRIFDAAENAGCVLLFDEADALFGKRSEVKDSHDRYANIEVGYLLQRMESYRGCAVLTTNMKGALDQAFLRRIRFLCQFPFPSAELRQEIWRRVFPARTPTEDLDVRRLARLDVAGGNIRNIAMNAAFLAADGGEPVRMIHVLRAARGEYAKIEKLLPSAELRGVA